VGRSPTPIVIYNVEGELDSPTTKYDNRQNLDDGMMWTRGGDGERKHLLQKALPIFVEENSYMIHLLGKYIYIDIVKTLATGWVEGENFLLSYFCLSWICCWVCCKKWAVGFDDYKKGSLFTNYI